MKIVVKATDLQSIIKKAASVGSSYPFNNRNYPLTFRIKLVYIYSNYIIKSWYNDLKCRIYLSHSPLGMVQRPLSLVYSLDGGCR